MILVEALAANAANTPNGITSVLVSEEKVATGAADGCVALRLRGCCRHWRPRRDATRRDARAPPPRR